MSVIRVLWFIFFSYRFFVIVLAFLTFLFTFLSPLRLFSSTGVLSLHFCLSISQFLILVLQPDIDECVMFALCYHGRCENMPGMFRCTCDDGFQLDKQGTNCTGRTSKNFKSATVRETWAHKLYGPAFSRRVKFVDPPSLCK